MYVNAISSTSGNANILVPYTDINGTTYPDSNINVTYIGTTQGAGESLVIADGTLQNTIVNGTSLLNLIVMNTGTATLNSIQFTAPNKPADITYGNYGTSSSCKTDGSQSLTPGHSCTLTIIYQPIASESGGFTISSNANYTDSSGGTQSVNTMPVNILYSAIVQPAILTINPSNVTLSINADGHSSTTQSFVVTNNGSIATQIINESIPTGVTITSDNCTGKTIASLGYCTIRTQFGPSSTNINNVSNLTISYKSTSGSQPVNAYSTVSLAATTSALVQITNIAESGIFTGSSSTYSFTNSPLVPFVVNINIYQ